MSIALCHLRKSTKAKLKPVHVLGNIYFLMSPYDIDELCEWVRYK